jgi:hypothetical protein
MLRVAYQTFRPGKQNCDFQDTIIIGTNIRPVASPNIYRTVRLPGTRTLPNEKKKQTKGNLIKFLELLV